MRRLLTKDQGFRAICIHEAGHAIACHLYRIPIKSITVVPNGKYSGQVLPSIVNFADRIEDWNGRKAIALAERIVRACVAGEISQKRHAKASFRKWHSMYDWEIATNVSTKVMGDIRVALAWCHYLYLDMKNELSLDYNWHCIKSLARQLEKTPTMSGLHARRVIEASRNAFFHGDSLKVEIVRPTIGIRE